VSSPESVIAALARLRIGFGYDIHRFEWGLPLKLGGVKIDYEAGLTSHTDGDAVCHAVTDALLSACGAGDIGMHFPPGDKRYKDAESLRLLGEMVTFLRRRNLEQILNVTVTVVTEEPKLRPWARSISGSLAAVLGLDPSQVAVGAGTNEKFDAVGQGEALVAFANVLLLVREGAMPPLPPAHGAVPSTAQSGEHIPERVKQFEKAVTTKLPPLPQAPRPQPGATLILYTDGASRGNPGPASTGWVLFDDQGRVVHEQGTTLGRMSNNEAEYAAVLEALSWVEKTLGTQFSLELRMDSELLVKQLKGEYRVKAPNLQPTWLLAMNALGAFDNVVLKYVPRAENARADALANRALDDQKGAT
jgi:2-C-methyl-D-erythritol 2,4-cyclodiphosphate synthase